MSYHIKSFRLSDCEDSRGYKRVLLQLFGLMGNGKSSFINSCKFVVDGGTFVHHTDASSSHGAGTTERISYELTDSIHLVDNRGMLTLERLYTGQIFAQLGDLVPLNQRVEWCDDYNKNVDRILEEHRKREQFSDFIVPIFVHKSDNRIPEQELKYYKELLNTARNVTGVNPFIVLTHKYSGGAHTMRSIFKDMGMDKIYTIENYTRNDSMEVREKHEEILNFLKVVLEDVKFRLKYMKSPRDESYARMNFVLKYIKETSDKEKEMEMERRLYEMQRSKPEENSSCLLQ